jgi:xylose isomerase
MILVNIEKDKIKDFRDKVIDVTCKLNFENNILISPIIQEYNNFVKYRNASGFFKNIKKFGVKISA